MTVFFGCAAMLPAIILSYILQAWAVVTLWTWFIYPMWHLAVPSKPVALGLTILVGALTRQPTSDRGGKSTDAPWEVFTTAYAQMLLPPLLAVSTGWIVKGWM